MFSLLLWGGSFISDTSFHVHIEQCSAIVSKMTPLQTSGSCFLSLPKLVWIRFLSPIDIGNLLYQTSRCRWDIGKWWGTCQDNWWFTEKSASPHSLLLPLSEKEQSRAEPQMVITRQNPSQEHWWAKAGQPYLWLLVISTCCHMYAHGGGEMDGGASCWLEHRPKSTFLCLGGT